MRTRSFQAFLVFLLLTTGVMAPAMAQDEGTPPLIEPSNEQGNGNGNGNGQGQGQDNGQEQDNGQGQGNGGTLEMNFELGNGGQPAEFPREIAVDGMRFLFDRLVPGSRQELLPVANEGEIQAFATTESAPFDAIYLSVPPRNEDQLGRYLPEQIGAGQISCASEAGNYGQLDVSGTIYLFAGIETLLTADDLQQVANDSNGQPVYADPGTEQPFPEIFFPDSNGLARFILTSGSGAPFVIAESLAIEGTQFAFTAEVTGQVDPGTLAKIGCAGPFPVYGEADAASGTRYAVVGERVFQYAGEAPVAAATEVPATLEPTLEPTEVPATSEPTLEPTEVPPTPEPTQIPTEVPPTAEPTQVPTEVPPTPEPTQAPTEAPAAIVETEGPAATEVPAEQPTTTSEPTQALTEAPADAPPATSDAATEAPVPTDVPEGSGETVAIPAVVEDAATGADAPAQVEVMGTTYFFAQTDVDIDISTLVEIQVITVNNIELTVYAEQELSGVAPSIYCLDNEGRLVGQYVPAAAFEPQPPAQLPPTINVNNATYIFNQVEVNIDVQNLTQVEVTTVQNIEVTIYMEQAVQGQPTRYFAIANDGQVVGQYVAVSIIQVVAQPTQTLQPPAVVPTQAPDAPPPAAVTAVADTTCAGNPGPINAQGLPTYLPNRIQIGGVSYGLVGPESPADAGTLTRISCIGAFEVASTDKTDRAEVLYLRYLGGGEAGQSVYRFEVAITFSVEFEVIGNAQRIQTGEQGLRLTAVWTKAIHTSGSVNLFVANPDEQSPEVYFGVNVSNTVVGDVIGEYRKADTDAQPKEGMVAAGERYGLHADLTVRGQRYLLVNVFLPAGTTTNGFLTLFSATGEGEAALLLGRDKRDLELFIYEPIAQETGG